MPLMSLTQVTILPQNGELVSKLKQILKVILSYLPERLPVGRTAFDAWAGEIIELSDIEDNDSTRFAVAAMVTHQDAKEDRIPKRRFIRQLNKTAANQVALDVIRELKERHEAKKEAESGKAGIQDAPAAVV
jgi:hypothetical protein